MARPTTNRKTPMRPGVVAAACAMVLVFLIGGCPIFPPITPFQPDVTRDPVTGTIAAPGAMIVSEGSTYDGAVGLAAEGLVGIVKDGQPYLYHSSLGDVELSEHTSRRAVGAFLLENSPTLPSAKSAIVDLRSLAIGSYQTLSTGTIIRRISDNNYEAINEQRRWIAIKRGNTDPPIFIQPRSTYATTSVYDWSQVIAADWHLEERVNFDVRGDVENLEIFCAVSRATMFPAALPLIAERAQTALEHDPQLFIQLNALDFGQVLIDGVGKLSGLGPAGDCYKELGEQAALQAFQTFFVRVLGGDNQVAQDMAEAIVADSMQGLVQCACSFTVACEFVNRFLAIVEAGFFVADEAVHGNIDILANDAYASLDLSTEPPADSINPTVSISSPTSGQTFSTSSITVSGSANDPGSPSTGINLVEVRINSGSWLMATGTNSWSRGVNLSGGSNVIEARSRDGAGNYSTNASINLTYNAPADTINPTVSISSPTNGQTVSTSSIIVSGSASDPGSPSTGISLVEVRINSGSWQSATGTTSWSKGVSLSAGGNTIDARSKDGAGNYSAIASTSVTYSPPASDPAPDLVSVSGIPSSVNVGQSFTVTITAENDGGTSPEGAINASVLYSNGSDSNITISNHSGAGLTLLNRPAGYYPIYNNSCNPITAADRLLEGYETDWTNGESHSMSFTVTPQQAGTLWVRVRTTMAADVPSCDYINDTSISGGVSDTDQQGWTVRRFAVTVVQPDPAPDLVSVSGIPSSVNVGQSFTVTITAENDGGTSPEGAINASVLYSNGSDSNITISNHSGAGLTLLNRPAGYYPIYNNSCNPITAADRLLEGYETDWTNGESHSMSFTVTPQQAGTLWVRVRTTMAADVPSCDYINDTSISGGVSDTDQQGWTVRRFAVTVESSGVSCCIGTCVCPEFASPIPDPTTSWRSYTDWVSSSGWSSRVVQLQSGNSYTFKTGCGDGATAEFDTVIEVYEWSNCTLVACNDDDCESYRSTVTFTAATTGEFVIKVRGYDSSEWGNVTVKYRRN